MKREAWKNLCLWSVGLAACGVLACEPPAAGGGNGPDTQGKTGANVEACKATLASRLETLQAEGIDVQSWPIEDAPEMAELTTTEPQTQSNFKQYDGHYRPLSNHPGCTTANLYYDKSNTAGTTPYKDGNLDGKWTEATALGGPNQVTAHLDGDKADIPGYPCAAKEYAQPNEDTSKPIIILVQGNSTRPHTWEQYLLPPGTEITSSEDTHFTPDSEAREQLADKLIAAGHRVIAVDLRTDLANAVDPSANNTTENQAGNIDHGWGTPIVQSLIKAVMTNHPDRKVSLVGHSLGATVARDALRRMFVEFLQDEPGAVNPFPQLDAVVLASGANQGVSTYDPPASLCGPNPTMRGTIVCEMGSRSNYVQTYFHKPLNGPKGLFSTPCADGDYAFGTTGNCGGNVVRYYTITMSDVTSGSRYQDLYVSEAAARLEMEGCATNTLTTLTDYDTSGYFVKGLIANHFGSVRSDAGMALVMKYLAE
jgi:pimeloyl-ACP methyl ester carboxylesterase